MSWQEIFVNPEIAPDDDPWEIEDHDHDANVEWAQAIFTILIVCGVVSIAIIVAGLLTFLSMVF